MVNLLGTFIILISTISLLIYLPFNRSDTDLSYNIYLSSNKRNLVSTGTDGIIITTDNASADSLGEANQNVNFSGNDNEEIAWDFFISKGLTEYASAGIMGNLQQEAPNIDPLTNQNKKYYGIMTFDNNGFGIAQWTNTRQTDLKNYCSDNSYNPLKIEGQLNFLWYELTTSYFKTVEKLNKAADYKEACKIFEEEFERAGDPQMSKRYQYAKETYEKFSLKLRGV